LAASSVWLDPDLLCVSRWPVRRWFAPGSGSARLSRPTFFEAVDQPAERAATRDFVIRSVILLAGAGVDRLRPRRILPRDFPGRPDRVRDRFPAVTIDGRATGHVALHQHLGANRVLNFSPQHTRGLEAGLAGEGRDDARQRAAEILAREKFRGLRG